MLQQLNMEAGEVTFKINIGKTKIVTNLAISQNLKHLGGEVPSF